MCVSRIGTCADSGPFKEKGTSEPSEIAAKLKISEESALYFIGKVAREKKLRITEVRG